MPKGNNVEKIVRSGISFSVEEGRASIEDRIKSAEQYFNTNEDPDQLPITKENILWVNKNIPDCDNIIKFREEHVGFTFILPCTVDLMETFISSKISEKELFEMVKKRVNYENFDAVYLCSAFIKPEFRRQGLALKGVVKSISKITKRRAIRPTLFYWAYTEEGDKLAQKVAESLDLKIKVRK